MYDAALEPLQPDVDGSNQAWTVCVPAVNAALDVDATPASTGTVTTCGSPSTTSLITPTAVAGVRVSRTAARSPADTVVERNAIVIVGRTSVGDVGAAGGVVAGAGVDEDDGAGTVGAGAVDVAVPGAVGTEGADDAVAGAVSAGAAGACVGTGADVGAGADVEAVTTAAPPLRRLLAATYWRSWTNGAA